MSCFGLPQFGRFAAEAHSRSWASVDTISCCGYRKRGYIICCSAVAVGVFAVLVAVGETVMLPTPPLQRYCNAC